MLLHCQIQNEKLFFEANWKHMVDDYKLKLKHQYHPIDYSITDDELIDMLLDDLQQIFLKNNLSIDNFNLPPKTRQYKNYYTNRLIEEEMAYNILELEEKANRLYNQLNNEQKMLSTL